MLGSIFGKQSTCLNADRVGVNCIFAISLKSWHDDIWKYNSRSVSCLSFLTMQMQTFSKMYVGLAGAVWCVTQHIDFSFSAFHQSTMHNVGGIRQERVGEMPVSSFIIYDHYNRSWHPMLYSTHTSYLFFLFKSLLVKCGDVSCIERIVILYDEIECDWQDWTETVTNRRLSCQLACGQCIMPHFLRCELSLWTFYIAYFVHLSILYVFLKRV